MAQAVDQWKEDFVTTRLIGPAWDRIMRELETPTRASKKYVNNLFRSAWKAHVHRRCGSFQLAMLFLRYPAAAVDTLLKLHISYMRSTEHAAEVARSQAVDTSDEEAQARKKRQQSLKQDAEKKKSHRQKMRFLHKQICAGALLRAPRHLEDRSWRWLNGDLDRDIDYTTRKHGYGWIKSGNPQALGAQSFASTVWR